MSTGARNAQPLDRNIVGEATEYQLDLKILPLVFSRSTPGFLFRPWFFGFMSAQFFVFIGIVPGLLNGRVHGNPAMGWLIVAVFAAFSTAILL